MREKWRRVINNISGNERDKQLILVYIYNVGTKMYLNTNESQTVDSKQDGDCVNPR
jgi:hypothetical protein